MRSLRKLELILLDNGICMAGGGSLLQGIVPRLSEELRMHVFLAEDPMTCVARGAGIVSGRSESIQPFTGGY